MPEYGIALCTMPFSLSLIGSFYLLSAGGCMRLRRTMLLSATNIVAVALLFPLHDLPAQASRDVKYTTVTKVEFGGRLGRVMRFFRKNGKAVAETLSYSGSRMRRDYDKESQVVDAKAGTVMTLEHPPRTYWLWSVNDPVVIQMGDSIPETPRRRPKTRYTITLSADKTGERQVIAGLEAEQTTVFLRIDGETYYEETDSVEKGSLVVLSDVWLTQNFPGLAAQRTFDSTWAARTRRDLDSAAVAEAAKAMEQAYSEEPRLRAAFLKLDSALAALKGYSLKTVSHYVAVPDGATFDREKVLRDADKGLVADLAEGAAQNAMNKGRERLGRLAGGRLGGGNRGPKPEQVVIMRSRDEITELSTDPIPADRFQPPPNYRRRTPGETRP
jgi:hypothetical protein